MLLRHKTNTGKKNCVTNMPHVRAMLVQITFPALAKVRKAAKVTAFYRSHFVDNFS